MNLCYKVPCASKSQHKAGKSSTNSTLLCFAILEKPFFIEGFTTGHWTYGFLEILEKPFFIEGFTTGLMDFLA